MLLWGLSAAGPAALRARAATLLDRLEAEDGWRPADIGWSLARFGAASGRRAAIAADTPDAFREALRALAEGRGAPGLTEGDPGRGRVVFAFPGNGSQWQGMAVELLDSAPVFRDRIRECDEALAPFVDWSLLAVLTGAPGAPALDRTDVIQPSLFATMVALAQLWRSYGIEPSAVLGHSLGEIAAAVVADALSLEDGCRIVALWSRAMYPLTGHGEMVSVLASPEALAPRLAAYEGRLELAVINGPQSVIVSGDLDATVELIEELTADGVRVRATGTGLAVHSAHIDRITPELREQLRPVRPRPARLPFYSSLLGGLLPADVPLDADYWCRNIRAVVDFEHATRAVLEDGHSALLEVSVHPVLTGAARQTVEDMGLAVPVRASLRRDQAGLDRIVRALGEQYVDGSDPDWDVLYAGSDAQLVSLPEPAPEPETPQQDTAAPALRELLSGLSEEDQRALVLDRVTAEIAGLLGSPTAVAPDRQFRDLGFDSVTALETCSRIGAAVGLRLPVTMVFDYPTPAELAEFVRVTLVGAGPEAVAAPAAAAADDDPAVIVGIGCRYPGDVSSPDDLWRLVRDGVDAMSPFPDNRGWDVVGSFDDQGRRAGTFYQREAGFLHDADLFDADFFGISPREALAMDPQQRLLLETTWEAFERAGIPPSSLHGSRTGVFIGAMTADYSARLEQRPDVEGYILTGNTGSVLSGRVSYVYGFEGPSVTVDTACSSSLVALHLAVQAVRRGECPLAVAAGVAVDSSLRIFKEFARLGTLAPDGRCKAFSDDADGFGISEGVGVLLVERLSDARRQGHDVLAVIRGTAINQDGASNGLAAPNGPSQQRVIRAALADAGLGPSDVDAVDAHGTGTKMGDPIEAQALINTYGQGRETPLRLGTLKSNLGHMQAAAGVGGIIKMVEAMRHGVLPRTLHVATPSSYVDWSAGAVSLLTEQAPWPESGRPRRAGVSSFGVSGTNAHVVLEQAPDPAADPAEGTPAGPAPLALSARGPVALRGQAAALLGFLEARPDLPVADVAAELLAARSTMDHRAVVVGADRDELLRGLAALAEDAPAPGVVSGVARAGGAVFLFPGQGTQWQGMGLRLLRSSPVFAESLRACAAALAPWTDYSVLDVLEGAPGAPDLDRVDVVQPVLWAVMVSLAEVWRSYGVVPSAVVGHSQGEIAAAYVAGALSLEDAAKVVAVRSRALRALSGSGAMASIAAAAELVEERLGRFGGALSVAVVNSPTATVVSGDPEALRQLVDECVADGLRARVIPVDYASHSAHVERIRAELDVELAGVRPRSSSVRFHSTVTGAVLDTAELDAAYWYRNLREPVRFAEVCRSLLGRGQDLFIECGPHPVLTMAVEECAEADGVTAVAVPTLRRHEDGPDQVQLALARAWVAGAPVHLRTDLPRPVRRLGLPTYAFQRERFWADLGAASTGDAAGLGLTATEHPLLGAATELAEDGSVLLTGLLSPRTQPWLADHEVAGTVLFPGTGFLELALRAGDEVGCGQLEELTLQAPLALPAGGDVRLQVRVGAADSGRRALSIHSRGEDGSWRRHATGVLVPAAPAVPGDLLTWPPTGARPIAVDGLYELLAGRGYGYGPAFQGVRAAWRRGGEVFLEVALPAAAASEQRYGLHPALLDAALHGLVLGDFFPAEGTWLPFSWQGVVLSAAGATELRVRLAPAGPAAVSVLAADPTGRPVLAAESMVLRPVTETQLRAAGRTDSLHTLTWTPLSPVPEAGSGRLEWAVLGPDDLGLAKALDVTGHAGLAELVAAMDAGGSAPDVVVLPCPAEAAGDAAEVHRTLHDLLGTVRSWLAEPRLGRCPLVVLTQGAVAAGEVTPAPGPAAVWGFIRSAQEEHPGRFVLGDVLDADERSLRTAVACGEPEFAVRAGTVLLPRLVRSSEGATLVPPGDGTPWRLAVTGTRGSFEDLSPVPCPEVGRALAPGEIRIGVRAAGLNFRDVVLSLGMLPGQTGIGTEGAGVVVEVGPDVTDLAPGDRVMGVLSGAFGPTAVVDRRFVVRMPAGWSYERGASVPSAYLTALYGLRDVAGLTAGEAVLVHAAAGGVGTAAVQVAQALGAQVFATAGPAKWPAVVAMGVEESRLLSSRTLDFEAGFRSATAGAGVDVVLNSLTGDFVDASLRLLRPGGRFVELGKTDLRDPAEVAASCPGVGYEVVDLSVADPDLVQRLLLELVDLFEAGTLRPPPVRSWDVRRAPEAFRHMSQARHVGKIVLRIPREPDPDGTVLITGATGVVGGAVARHLVAARGVRRVLLLGRRGRSAPGMAELADELAGLGAAVAVEACDVADREAMAGVLARIPAAHPLTAVVHAAGVLEDALLQALSAGQLDAVLRPKVDGALVLHELTAGLDLAQFVLFSSAAGLTGSAGQANYTAANTFLDALAQRRWALGLPAVSVAWGLWGERSAMTADADLGRLARLGLLPMTGELGLELFDLVTGLDEPLVLAARVDPAGLRARADEGTLAPVWRGLVRATARSARESGPADPGGAPLTRRLAGLPETEQHRMVLGVVRTHAATVLGRASAQTIDAGRGFVDLGFDSLTAVELRNRLGAATGLRLPSTLVFDYPNPDALARYIRAGLVVADPPARPAAPADPDGGEEAELRRLLATIPLTTFKEAGLMDVLLELADRGAPRSGPDPAAERVGIDAMSVDDLLKLAPGKTS